MAEAPVVDKVAKQAKKICDALLVCYSQDLDKIYFLPEVSW